MNNEINYTFETPAATVTVQVKDKESGQGTKNYVMICHDRLKGVYEAGPIGLPLAERINRVVRAFSAVKRQMADWVELMRVVRLQFKRVIAMKDENLSTALQAELIVDRLQEVQSRMEHVEALNKNQFLTLVSIAQRVNSVGFHNSTSVDENVAQLVTSYKTIESRIDEAEKQITKIMGVNAQVQGTPAARLDVHLTNLATALEANKRWSEMGSTLPLEERTHLQNIIDALRADNKKLREQLIRSICAADEDKRRAQRKKVQNFSQKEGCGFSPIE